MNFCFAGCYADNGVDVEQKFCCKAKFFLNYVYIYLIKKKYLLMLRIIPSDYLETAFYEAAETFV